MRFRLASLALLLATPAAAQSFPTDDPVIKRIWDEGMTAKSQAATLAQALMDSIGPRLAGSPGYGAAVKWLQQRYTSWGIPVRTEQYGTWRGWQRYQTHMDLVAPRFRTLEATMLAWSPGTKGPVEGAVAAPPPAGTDEAGVTAWLAGIRGKFVLGSWAEPTCRPSDALEKLARPETVKRIAAERDQARADFVNRVRAIGRNAIERIEAAGALGMVTGNWSNGWGVDKVFDADTRTIPTIQLSCEDFGLVSRLADRNQGPRLRLDARSEFLGDAVPMFNVIAELKGTEKPDEYVVLSAHLDSWDGASGATDNGTGTTTMLEAMRILKLAYPNPKRTILVGHWGGEEQGLIGSGAFAADHPEVIDGLQAAFNQDNGTWRIEYIRMMGYTGAGANFARWFGKIPGEIENLIDFDIPGVPERGGSDHMSFICHGAPGFRLQSHYPEYRQYTWHTNRDTYDKVVLDDLMNNATLAAMLAYQASEDPERVPRDQRVLPPGPNGQPQTWPGCGPPRRSWSPGQ
jgi:carboxypeptidase Q